MSSVDATDEAVEHVMREIAIFMAYCETAPTYAFEEGTVDRKREKLRLTVEHELAEAKLAAYESYREVVEHAMVMPPHRGVYAKMVEDARAERDAILARLRLKEREREE